ncbi:MAG: ATP-binding protein [Patescibacteria group bacterium]
MPEGKVDNQQSQLNAILSSMAEGLVAVDRDLKIIMMNQATGVMLRVAPPEAVGQDVFKIFSFYKDDQPLPPEAVPLRQAIEDKNIVTISLLDNISLKTRQGRMFPAAMVLAPLLKDGEVSGGIILLRDITKEKEVDQAKTEFVSLASHQLRTPLSAINWYSEMLLDEDVGGLNDKQKEYLASLHEANRRMIDLVNSLLNVSRIDLGTFAVEPEPTDLRVVAESVLEELQPKILEKKIRIEKNYDVSLSTIMADPKLIRIVFQNLLSNAVKYTPTDGAVTVSITRREPVALIAVSDTGYGIPAADKTKIFTKLFRADNIRDKEAEGTGLGLYIVKSIIENFGGRIWFDSLEGKGTTFSVELPLSGMIKKAGSKGLT